MKQVKNLSVANIKGTNFVRREDLDFEDDGSHFRGFAYKNLPITTLYSDGRVYCSVRPDYINYNNVPWEMWKETEEYNLGDKYNGTEDLIDLDDLADICEKTLLKLNELKKQFETMELDSTPVLRKLKLDYVKIDDELNWFKTINWFDKPLSEYELHDVQYHYNNLKGALNYIDKMEKDIILGTVDKAKLYQMIKRIEENPDYDTKNFKWHSDSLKELEKRGNK